MAQLPSETIRKKRDGESLSSQEIKDFFERFLTGEVTDYQLSAMLMAIAIRGMNDMETSELTQVMRDSGEVLTWNMPSKQIIDKHSTGGVGDKTSLVLLPLAALEGAFVPMMSGRGLGHSGGTLDKLESIPGMNVRLSIDQTKVMVERHGGVFIGQTGDLAPLDKAMYAMRDVTGTVESIPLITASILSKKLAEGLGGLVMDVKFGSGAFMKDLEQACLLAKSIRSVAQKCGVRITCLLTSMNNPLGRSAGNTLEVKECLDILRGSDMTPDTRDLSIALAAHMVLLSDSSRDYDEIVKAMSEHLKSGRALEKFSQIITDQGGDCRYLEHPERFVTAKYTQPVHAASAGYVTSIDVRNLGLAVVELGGGRRKAADEINHAVGLTDLKHIGEVIDNQVPLAVIHGDDRELMAKASSLIAAAYRVGAKTEATQLIQEVWQG